MHCLKRPCLGHFSSGVTTDGSTRKIYVHQTEAKRLILENSVESAYQGNMTLSQDLDPFSETYHGYPMQVPDAKCRCVSGFPIFAVDVFWHIAAKLQLVVQKKATTTPNAFG